MTTTKRSSETPAWSDLLAAGAESRAVREANPAHYWAQRGEGGAAHYYWEDVPVSRAEYLAAKGEDLPQP